MKKLDFLPKPICQRNLNGRDICSLKSITRKTMSGNDKPSLTTTSGCGSTKLKTTSGCTSLPLKTTSITASKTAHDSLKTTSRSSESQDSFDPQTSQISSNLRVSSASDIRLLHFNFTFEFDIHSLSHSQPETKGVDTGKSKVGKAFADQVDSEN